MEKQLFTRLKFLQTKTLNRTSIFYNTKVRGLDSLFNHCIFEAFSFLSFFLLVIAHIYKPYNQFLNVKYVCMQSIYLVKRNFSKFIFQIHTKQRRSHEYTKNSFIFIINIFMTFYIYFCKKDIISYHIIQKLQKKQSFFSCVQQLQAAKENIIQPSSNQFQSIFEEFFKA
ncbi:transmembrane protein, putative (macronuclear) [Tetrahymena thermophila SB210]|uniref:Transmembrane protein, putative n=1 Tax=Tetrahymena thermophila (strain SB210) TaxID=312017 RepID=W7XB98_TETTS|nr:transmembrane protein, putative [Tetrahymena thermophila SB210]EWS73698.1 transmembrane protein, putative [Tetrahymena thermophila SB210]|eukprot:XP_012653736.1 transmembrane protein, putative [Tetrahymena thermophila SB210]